ncbi:hypothetical protein [Azospirillum brasilense]|uniref:hypothetical protein n=1 Tax=Azospirillum brasilense TaxID=192 RepID=UPI000E68BA73|nr:hypothetical protein [Azospirillum brasilense]NUB24897.1 hypothetical protein [Azospirillum brasilense]NUB30497.1 hypothetical protein [Azospirillum brasilense]RIW02486.1 hypothetical protein D2T81_15425 [Azospirillum brasilense]
MTDLQRVFTHDDALDDELRDGLSVGKGGVPQPPLDVFAEGGQVRDHLPRVRPLLTQLLDVLQLQRQGLALIGQMSAALREFVKSQYTDLVGIQKALIGLGQTAQALMNGIRQERPTWPTWR